MGNDGSGSSSRWWWRRRVPGLQLAAVCMAAVCMTAAGAPVRPRAASGSATVGDKWWYLGPWPTAKTEGEADPAEGWGGIRALYAARSRGGGGGGRGELRLPSEVVDGGFIRGWQSVTASGQPMGGMTTPSVALTIKAPINWQALVNAVGMEAVEVQGWAVTSLRTAASGVVAVRCVGVPAVAVAVHGNGSWVAGVGDMYGTGRGVLYASLPAGRHDLYVHVRAKVQAVWACEASLVRRDDEPPAPPRATGSLFLPDVWAGVVAGEVAAVTVVNPDTTAWRRVACAGVLSAAHASPSPPHPAAVYSLAPGATLLTPCALLPALRHAAAAQCDSPPRSGAASAHLAVYWQEGVSDGSGTAAVGSDGEVDAAGDGAPWHLLAVPATLACRTIHQSATFTFMDHDGSVAQAGFIAPLPASPLNNSAGAPILLTFHGTGVAPRGQADAYKWKPNAGDADYTFGVAGYWVLAPGRGGAHNWQGAGQWHAFAALTAFGEWVAAAVGGAGAAPASCPPAAATRSVPACLPRADASRVLFAGHSMGGAGAWHAATAAPDLALALAPAAGWLVKEGYGDANTPFWADLHEPAVDGALKAVLLAAVADQRPDTHASNIAGMPTHVRVGANDATTHPWYSRRMARLVADAHAAVSGTPPCVADRSSGGDGECAVTLEEVGGKEHWWWDTVSPNDGGVVNDAVMRAFYARVASHNSTAAGWAAAAAGGSSGGALSHTLPARWVYTVTNPSTYARGRGGVRIVAQRVPGRVSTVEVEVVSCDLGWWSLRVWRVAPANVAALRGRPPAPGADDARAALRPRAHLAHAAVTAWCRDPTAQRVDSPRVSRANEPLVMPVFLCVDGAAFAVSDVVAGGGLCRNSSTAPWRQGAATATTVTSKGAPPDGPPSPAPPPRTAFVSPARAVTSRPFVVVVGEPRTNATRYAAWMQFAHFLAASHAAAYDTTAPIVPHSSWQPGAGGQAGAIVLGDVSDNAAAAHLVPLPSTLAGCDTAALTSAASGLALYVTAHRATGTPVLHITAGAAIAAAMAALHSLVRFLWPVVARHTPHTLADTLLTRRHHCRHDPPSHPCTAHHL